MGPIPVKRTKRLIKAELEAKAQFTLSSKGIQASLIHMIDRIDPLELLAVAATSFVVYDIIKSVPELTAKATTFIFTDVAKYNPFLYIAGWIVENIGKMDLTFTPEQVKQLEAMKNTPDLLLFVKSFAIAYIIVKHSGQIINGVGNITGFIGTFLGLKVA